VSLKLLSYALNVQSDVVGARQRARQLAELLGFDGREQTRIATSVSEIARNAFRYAGGGKVEFEIEGETPPQLFVVRVSDEGPGIRHLDEVLEGTYRSTTGMGIGLIGSRRLMDRWDIRSVPGKGTVVTLGKLLPPGSALVTPLAAGRIVSRLAAMPNPTSISEVQSQNAELLGALAELQEKQEKLQEVARELEDTNRGVVALYAELEEKALHLRRADEMKTRFLSNMSHEFRTPLNSIRALCKLLLAKADGPLAPEQETQVRFVAKAADNLAELVDDLLDLAKIEAGKVDVRPARLDVHELFSALRGMLKPLLVTDTVELSFQAADDLPAMYTDESKVSQILRNFISNALKFTERGSVQVSARLADEGDAVLFEVRDTGIGIAAADQELVFEEFTQVQGPLQRKVKGTGLGLPLTRRLAGLLGGGVGVTSRVGEGSTFWARIPLRVREADAPLAADGVASSEAGPSAFPDDGHWVLVIEDDPATRLLYEKYLKGTPYPPLSVASLNAAREILRARRPAAAILDILLPGEEEQTWRWLAEVKGGDRTFPVIVASDSGDARKAYALGADAYFDKPVVRDKLIAELDRLTAREEAERLALIIDDDEAARYVIRRSVPPPVRFEEASDGQSGLAMAARMHPGVIFLDIGMPDMSGDEVLQRLKSDPGTAPIPVIVVTSHEIDDPLRERLAGASAILQKRELSVETLTRALVRLGE
jgi:signal transduction histidine kinase/CheY-like chemotaxis protein